MSAAAADSGAKSDFEGKDFYVVLSISKTADLAEIKRAYRSMALKHHPDKNAGREESVKDFQVLGRIMEVLGDAKKRELYDRFGTTDSEADSMPFEEQYEHWRSIFRKVTGDDIEAFAKSYRESKEERDDLYHYYRLCAGDLVVMLEWIPLSRVEDIDRYCASIDAGIKAGDLTKYKAYPKSKSKAKRWGEKYAAEADEAEQLKSELLAKATADVKAIEGGKLSMTIVGSAEDRLRVLIQSLSASRHKSMISSLQEKYGGDGGSKKKRKPAEPEPSEPTEEEFEAIQAQLTARKKPKRKSAAAASK